MSHGSRDIWYNIYVALFFISPSPLLSVFYLLYKMKLYMIYDVYRSSGMRMNEYFSWKKTDVNKLYNQ